MKPAEQWAVEVTDCASGIEAVELIQQIQADALRWAMRTANAHEIFISRAYVESLEDLANQLDPRPKRVSSKDVPIYEHPDFGKGATEP